MAEEVEFRLCNTMMKHGELFPSTEPGKVKMYVCGVTPGGPTLYSGVHQNPSAKNYTNKYKPTDFALCKAAKAGEPSCDIPWGPGRPDCPELRCLSESNVSYWMHNGFVNKDGEKVTRLYHPLALRYFLLGAHYCSPVNHLVSQIEYASESVFYIYQTLHDCERALSLAIVNNNAPECINRLHNELETNLADDLHTPTILKDAFQDAHKLINTYLISPHQFVLSLTEIKKEVKAVLMSLDCSLLVELVLRFCSS
ncbi:hypothetical protein H5410_010222 [Solanum commersonii]|uniref:Uncharacterized protein n=1 Tax=Solanum commersonii TaxID=4109 RepID=A0A9J6AKZ9_SOLCO|nr:hypothetical protein H5410_010222 [Solanum commersonii]